MCDTGTHVGLDHGAAHDNIVGNALHYVDVYCKGSNVGIHRISNNGWGAHCPGRGAGLHSGGHVGQCDAGLNCFGNHC